MTSKKCIWSYPGKKYNSKSIILMPELNLFEFINCGYIVMKHYDCFGICSDYVGKIK